MRNFIVKKRLSVSRPFLHIQQLLFVYWKNISSVKAEGDRKQVFRESVNDRATAQNRNQLNREDGSSKMARDSWIILSLVYFRSTHFTAVHG